MVKYSSVLGVEEQQVLPNVYREHDNWYIRGASFPILLPISVRPEETFTHLHYLLRGLCPIETVYLRLSIGPTIIVTTVVLQGFSRQLPCHQVTNFLNLPALAKHQPPYMSPRPNHCDPLYEEASLLPKLQGYFVEFLRESCLLALGISTYPFVSIPGIGTLLLKVVRAFPRSIVWITSTPKCLVLEHWIVAFSLPLLTLKK
ncbi:hypothetical protein V6Z12_D10G130200 [Gossypium hirsutum]